MASFVTLRINLHHVHRLHRNCHRVSGRCVGPSAPAAPAACEASPGVQAWWVCCTCTICAHMVSLTACIMTEVHGCQSTELCELVNDASCACLASCARDLGQRCIAMLPSESIATGILHSRIREPAHGLVWILCTPWPLRAFECMRQPDSHGWPCSDAVSHVDCALQQHQRTYGVTVDYCAHFSQAGFKHPWCPRQSSDDTNARTHANAVSYQRSTLNVDKWT